MDLRGKAVLDVGCGTAAHLSEPIYTEAAELCGIDPDARALEYGRERLKRLKLTEGYAEALPYSDNHFDLVVSLVALPYTDLERSIPECYRVMKPGGELHLHMHDLRLQWEFFVAAMRALAWKRCLDHVYIAAASFLYLTIGKVPARPGRGTRETIQTGWSMRRDLRRAGFEAITTGRDGRHFVVTARKPFEESSKNAYSPGR
jgi:ubiquinone/menaquinone biosynthesis C-methylase UbiE